MSHVQGKASLRAGAHKLYRCTFPTRKTSSSTVSSHPSHAARKPDPYNNNNTNSTRIQTNSTTRNNNINNNAAAAGSGGGGVKLNQRIHVLLNHVLPPSFIMTQQQQRRLYHASPISLHSTTNSTNANATNNDISSTNEMTRSLHPRLNTIRIGNLSIEPYHQVPTTHGLPFQQNHSNNSNQIILHHLHWLLQKISIGQDCILIGPPGSLKRKLAFEVSRILNAEVEYVSITRDTNESDLKQRREITNQRAHYVDQAVVRAALHGRILILDGLERAERNLLPLLNNLLENREMALEDGRLMIRHERWQELHNDADTTLSSKVIPVHKDFRVIALSLPVPPFQGNPLDPPLRSRFQAREVHEDDLSSLIELPQDRAIEWNHQLITNVLQLLQSLSASVNEDLHHASRKSSSSQLPPFSLSHAQDLLLFLHEARDIMNKQMILDWLNSFYPVQFLSRDSNVVESIRETLERGASEIAQLLLEGNQKATSGALSWTVGSNETDDVALKLQRDGGGGEVSLPLRTGYLPNYGKFSHGFIPTESHEQTLQRMLCSHHLGRDICLIGRRSSGKSVLAHQFASLLGMEFTVFPCFAEMTSRDLLISRSTDSEGNTIWKHSPLLQCMKEGQLCVLDNVHTLDKHILMTLQTLIQDRQLFLSDGSRWISSDQYESMLQLGFSEKALEDAQIHCIHPSFSLMALALLPGKGEQNWFSSETLQLFHYHTLKDLSIEEERDLIMSIVTKENEQSSSQPDAASQTDAALKKLLLFKRDYNREMEKKPSKKKSKEITLREVLRIAHAMYAYPHDISLYTSIEQITMMEFLPTRLKKDILNMMDRHGIHNDQKASKLKLEVTDDSVQIGPFRSQKQKESDPTLVPKPFYVDTDEHLRCMRGLLLDQVMHQQVKYPGFHSLLIGNQGVGKNILTYALLNALNTEMEYMQLHRDITTYSLTVQPSVIDGVLKYTDSPLVRAVKHGRVLLLDEADKCPLEVVSIIRSLIADGEMVLSDGRRIVADKSEHLQSGTASDKLIEIHKDFRVIVLANRPNFPFHGFNFFAECGDLFQTLYVDNPSGENQLQMLMSYAPDVDKKLLEKLIACFEDLKQLNQEGSISYPYSTRELVSIAKHIQAFPSDGLVSAIGNVVSFDHFNARAFNHLRVVFERHGIPLQQNKNFDIQLSPQEKLVLKQSDTPISLQSEVHVPQSVENLAVAPFQRPEASMTIHSQVYNSKSTNHRSTVFSEHRQSIDCSNLDIQQIVTLPDKSIHALSVSSPLGLVSFHPPHYGKHTIFDLSAHHYLSNVQIASMGAKNRILLFGTTFVNQSNFSFTQGRRVALCLFVFNPKNSTTPCEKLMLHPTQYKHTYGFNMLTEESDSETPRLTLWSKENNDFFILTLKDESVSVQTVSVEKPIEKLEFLSAFEYLLTTNDGSTKEQYLVRVGSNTVSMKHARGSNLSHNSPKNIHQQFSSVDSKGNLHFLQASADKFDVLSAFEEDEKTPTKILGPVYTRDLALGESADKKTLRVVDLDKKLSLRLREISSKGTPSEETSPILSATQVGDSSGSIVTAHRDRQIRVWDIQSASLHKEANYWQQFMGDSSKPMRLEFDYHNDNLSLNGPKHGKEDNKPHVGGNTYAGGSGGRDTAGLGGVGGPYRLDKGHPVYQLPDDVKKNISKEALERARQMGKEAYRKRLNAIDMSDNEMSMYMQFYENVKDQIHHVRELLENLRAKEQDRAWIKGQTSGELDEGKIIEAVIGEEGIYKRRAKQEDLNSSFGQQSKPKTIRFVVDCSGSMYRFNGVDKRLERMMELVVLLMESLEGFEHKFRYEIVGHSGESPRVVFVPFDKPPKDQKERLKVILKMHAHSQFCWSGDNTMEATQLAIESAAQEEDSDERFVFCFSDANLARYGISPARFGEVLTSHEKEVKAFVLFIAGLGDEAERVMQQMPAGHVFVQKDTKFLSQFFEEIFTSHLIED